MLTVSIIVPVYNKEPYLDDCLNSLLNQTWHAFEVIIVNDGSTDHSQEIIDKFVEHDSRFHAFQAQHVGVSAARNAGIETATGEFLAFVDADDIIEPNYIKNMVLAINDSDLCIAGYKIWNVAQGLWKSYKCASIVFSLDELQKYILQYSGFSWGTVWGRLYHRGIVKHYSINFPVDMSYGEDLIFNLRYLMNAKQIALIHDDKYIYRIDDKQSLNTIARRKVEWHEKIISELEKMMDFLPELVVYFQMAKMWEIGIELCYQIKGFRNRRKSFYNIVKRYNLKEKSRKKKLLSKGGLIVKWTILTNTFLPMNILIRAVKGLR